MNNWLIIFTTITMVTFIEANAQNNLDIIEYHEAIKIISSQKYNLPDTPVIAILDKGVNLEHEDLKANIWINKEETPENGNDDDENGFIDDVNGWNFANNTNDVSIGGIGNWHGTPVNGIIGAQYDNNIGVKGVGPAVKLMNLVKGESIESVINALQYVYLMRKTYNETNGQSGAYIVAVNCSWGKDSLWASDYPHWCAMYDSLGSVGVLSTHSVPNNNINIDAFGDMPATCNSSYLITVTNSNRYDEKVYDAGFGSYSVDLAAPGNNTYTALNTGGYGYFGGTSAAAPHVSGLIGLLHLMPSDNFQQYVRHSPSELATLIKSVIMNGVDHRAGLANITVSGGRVNTFKSMKLLCDHFGEQHLYQNLFEPIQILSVAPTPASANTTVQIECNKNSDVSINIADIHGRNVFTQESYIQEGVSTVPINLAGLNAGFYIIHITSERIIKSTKLVIQ